MLLKYSPHYRSYISVVGIIVVGLFCLFYCFDYILQISISVFLDQIKIEYHLSDFELGFMGAIFFISYVSMQMPGGYLIDHLGAKKVVLFMLFCCTLATAMMELSDSYFMLIISRLLIGLGTSTAFLCAIRVIADWLPLNYFSFFIGVLQALLGFGAILGQSPIAYFNQFYTWHQISLVFAFIAAVLFIFFTFIKSNDRPIAHQSRASSKSAFHTFYKVIFDQNLLKLSLLSFIIFSPVASLAGFWLIPMLSDTYRVNEVFASFMVSFFWIGLMIGSLIIPIASDLIKLRKPILSFGFILQLISLCLLVFLHLSDTVVMGCLFTLGFICPIQGFIIVVVRDSYSQNLGLISGMLNMFAVLSGGVMQLAIGFLLTYFFKNQANPYLFSFMPYVVLSFIGVYISTFKLKETYPKHKEA